MKKELKEQLFEKAWEENKSEYLISLEDAYAIIDQLDEPEINSESLVNEIHRQFNENDYWEAEDVRDMAIDVIREHDTTAKPVIPQFVADWIETMKQQDFTLGQVAEHLYSGDIKWSSLSKYERWARLNFTKFARAWMDGYEVEEKTYEVIIGKGTLGGYPSVVVLYKSIVGAMVLKEMTVADYEDDKRRVPTSFWLTEKEIKDYDKGYWAFAEEVTE